MNRFTEQNTQALFEKNALTENQLSTVKAYRNLRIFSLHAELKLLLYASILSFTTGIGIVLYQNIDTISHAAILAIVLAVTVVCFYFSFKNAKGFYKREIFFENPVYDYIILAALLLSCIFIGYLQYQYTTFGMHYGLATLIPTAIGLFCAYYFDNKSILSIAITGLGAYIGLSVSPQALLNNDFYETNSLSYSAIGLGFILNLWTIYSEQIGLKKHFALVFLTFGLHLIGLSCINNLLQPFWFAFFIILAVSSFYYYRVSYQYQAVSLFIFSIIYAYIGFTILLIKLGSTIEFNELIIPFFFVIPLYFIASIVYFIKLVKQFNIQKKNDSLR